jgi:hypothetical protein
MQKRPQNDDDGGGNVEADDLFDIDKQLEYVVKRGRAERCKGIDYEQEAECIRADVQRARTAAFAPIIPREYAATQRDFLVEFEPSIQHDCVKSNCAAQNNLKTLPRGARFTGTDGALYEASGLVYVCARTGRRHICTSTHCELQRVTEREEAYVCALTGRAVNGTYAGSYMPVMKSAFESGDSDRGIVVPITPDTVNMLVSTQLHELRRTDVNNRDGAVAMMQRRLRRNARVDAAESANAVSTVSNVLVPVTATSTALGTSTLGGGGALTLTREQRDVALVTRADERSTALIAVCDANALHAKQLSVGVKNELTLVRTTDESGKHIVLALPSDVGGARRMILKPAVAENPNRRPLPNSPLHFEQIRKYFGVVVRSLLRLVFRERSARSYALQLRQKHEQATRVLSETAQRARASGTAVGALQLMSLYTRVTRCNNGDVARVLALGDRIPMSDDRLVSASASELCEFLVDRMLEVWKRVQMTPHCVGEQAWQHYRKHAGALLSLLVDGLSTEVCVYRNAAARRDDDNDEFGVDPMCAVLMCPDAPDCGHAQRQIVFLPPNRFLAEFVTPDLLRRFSSELLKQPTLSGSNALRLFFVSLLNGKTPVTLYTLEQHFCMSNDYTAYVSNKQSTAAADAAAAAAATAPVADEQHDDGDDITNTTSEKTIRMDVD